MTNILLSILEVTATMSAIILILLLFSKFFGKKFTAKCRYIAWTIVIIRLCLPAGILSFSPIFEIEVPEKISHNGIITEIQQDGEDVNAKYPSAKPLPIPKVTPNVNTTPDISNSTTMRAEDVKNGNVNPSNNGAAISQNNEKSPNISIISLISGNLPAVICAVWLAGAAISMSARLISYAVYLISYKRSSLLYSPDEKIEETYNTLCMNEEIKRPPELFVSKIPVSPHLCGFFRRKIIIPDMTYASKNVEGILLHELTHHKRGDLIVKFLCALAKSLYWFNPLVHIAAEQCVSEMEKSCDEAVLKNSSEEERLLYGSAMLDVARRCGHVKGAYLTSSFKPKRGATKERIMNILNAEKKRKGIIIISVVLVLCITAGIVIGCTVSPNENKNENTNDNVETAPETTPHITADPDNQSGSSKDYDRRGTWYSDENRTHALTIVDFNVVGEVKMMLKIVLNYDESIYATAVRQDNEYIFGSEILSEYSDEILPQYNSENLSQIKRGILKQNNDGISVTFEQVEPNTSLPIKDGDVYKFSVENESRTSNAWDFAQNFKRKLIKECARSYNYNHISNEEIPELEEKFAPLSTINFSEFSISEETEDNNHFYVNMKFTISESGYDLFPAGKYEGKLSEGPFGLSWDRDSLKKPNDFTVPDEYMDAVEFIKPHLPYMAKENYNPESYLENNFAHISITLSVMRKLYENSIENAAFTLEEIQDVASEFLGIDDFVPHPFNAMLYEDGKYGIPGHGGDSCFYNIKDISKSDDIINIDVQYYADTLCFSRGHVVRYTLRETGSVYKYRLEKTEIIEENFPPQIKST